MARSNTVEVLIKARDRATKEVGKVNQGLSKLEAAGHRVSRAFFSLKTAIAGIGVAWSAISVAKTGAAFEQTMAEVQGITRATKAEFEALETVAREMGESTEWSASQAAEGLKFLSMAGMTASQSITALPGMLDLATAGGIELGRAADIATDTLSAFRLEVEETGRVNDVFARTITTSNTNIELMSESMKYVAATAAGFGYSIEEASALIGILGNNGIKGSMAGTQLAQSFIQAKEAFDYYGVSARNADGSSKGLVEALELLEEQGATTEEVMELFGDRAGRAINSFLGVGTKAIRKYVEEINKAEGASTTLATTMRSTTLAAWKEWKSVVESIKIDIFDKYGESIKQFLKGMTEALRGSKDQVIDAVGVIGPLLVRMLAGVMRASGNTVLAFVSLKRGLHDIGTFAAAVATVFVDLAAAMNLLDPVTAFKSATQGFRAAMPELAKVRDSIDEFGESQALAALETDKLGNETAKLALVTDGLADNMLKMLERTQNAKSATKDETEAIKENTEAKKENAKASGGESESKAKRPVATLPVSEVIRSEMSVFLAENETLIAELESTFDRALVSADEYVKGRKQLILEGIDKEIELTKSAGTAEIARMQSQYDGMINEAEKRNLLQQILKARLKLEEELRIKAEERKRAEIELADLEADAEQNALDAKRDKDEALRDLRGRALEEDDVEGRFALEIEGIEAKHVRELEMLSEHGASKRELLEAQALQEQEIENKKAAHQKSLYEQRISWAKDFVGGMADSMQALYASGLAQSESMFKVYQAFAIAETIISTYSSAQKAYDDMLVAGGPWAIPLAVAAAAAAVAGGMARVAAIKSAKPQGYAYGGLIGGPDEGARADNVTIRATPGEYMMDRPTVRHYGVRVMEALRQRLIPRDLFSGVRLPAMRPAYAGPGFAFGGQVGASAGTDAKQDQSISIVNVLDPKTLDKYMATASGQRTVLNVISKNAGQINTILDR
jgi:TP901 family phage tail tape measure protein